MEIKEKKLQFGKYKSVQLKYVPDSYLYWGINNNVFKGKILRYAKTRLNYPKDNYKVTVTDSIDSDGDYFVEAYDHDQAKNICISKYNIQSTQSFHGTKFLIEKL